jgi:hypothetical protein
MGGPAQTRKVFMKKLFKRGLLGAVAVAVPLSAAMTLPMAANASSSTVTATTHSSNHPDTTSVSGPGTINSDNGPVWAYDNLSLQISAAPNGSNSYAVTVIAHGSFVANADPKTGAAYTGTGSVSGTLSYEVSSPAQPNAKNMPAQEPGTAHMSQIVNDLFGGKATNVTMNSYSFSYNPIDGGTYTQP